MRGRNSFKGGCYMSLGFSKSCVEGDLAVSQGAFLVPEVAVDRLIDKLRHQRHDGSTTGSRWTRPLVLGSHTRVPTSCTVTLPVRTITIPMDGSNPDHHVSRQSVFKALNFAHALNGHF